MQALNNNASTSGAWDAIHALSYHTYTINFESIVNETTSLYQQFGKPIWVTKIASGSNSTMEANVQLMEAFVNWANSQSWIERYFWNQAVSTLVVSWLFGTLPQPGSLCPTASPGHLCACTEHTSFSGVSCMAIYCFGYKHVVAPLAACYNCLWCDARRSLSMAVLVQHTCALHVALAAAADYMVRISRQNNSKLTSCSNLLQTPPEGTDPNIQNSYMVNESVGGKGNGTLTPLGQTYTSVTC